MTRKSIIERKTKETQVFVDLNIDGTGNFNIKTDCGFMKHMMELFTKHGGFDLEIACDGDSYVDYHHTVEDIGIALGQAFREALGDKKGVTRYGSIILPMDEALVLTSLDLSGRTFVNFDVQLPAARVGDFDTELVKEFLLAFAREMGLTLHIKQMSGENAHHIIEAVFKGFARTLSKACAIDVKSAGAVPSTKGIL